MLEADLEEGNWVVSVCTTCYQDAREEMQTWKDIG